MGKKTTSNHNNQNVLVKNDTTDNQNKICFGFRLCVEVKEFLRKGSKLSFQLLVKTSHHDKLQLINFTSLGER